jgi:hypothetical protein
LGQSKVTGFGPPVVWSLDGSQLFTASFDRSIRFWDSETGQAIGDPLTGHTDFFNSISLSPDGTKLASASIDGTVRFWATDSGDPIGEPLQHEHLQAITFSPSGEFVACGELRRKDIDMACSMVGDSKKVIAYAQLSCRCVSLPLRLQAHKSLLDVRSAQVFLQCPSHRLSCVAPSCDRTKTCCGDVGRQPRLSGCEFTMRYRCGHTF